MAKAKKQLSNKYEEKLKIEGDFEDVIGVSVTNTDPLKSVKYRYKDGLRKIVYTVNRKLKDENGIYLLDITVKHNYPDFLGVRPSVSITYDRRSNIIDGGNIGSKEEIADLILKNEGFE